MVAFTSLRSVHSSTTAIVAGILASSKRGGTQPNPPVRHRSSFSIAGRWHRTSSCLDPTRRPACSVSTGSGSDPYPCGSLTYRRSNGKAPRPACQLRPAVSVARRQNAGMPRPPASREAVLRRFFSVAVSIVEHGCAHGLQGGVHGCNDVSNRLPDGVEGLFHA